MKYSEIVCRVSIVKNESFPISHGNPDFEFLISSFLSQYGLSKIFVEILQLSQVKTTG